MKSLLKRLGQAVIKTYEGSKVGVLHKLGIRIELGSSVTSAGGHLKESAYVQTLPLLSTAAVSTE